jgi:AraC-like DNA-binding protein
MALIALGTADSEVSRRVVRGLDRRWHDVVQTPSWDALGRLVRERPVSLLLLDVARLPAAGPPALLGLRRDFPGLPLVMLARRAEPRLLFELGQARVSNLLLLDAEGSPVELGRALARALERGVLGLVSRQLTEILTPDALRVLRGALQLTHRCWGADRFAHSFGLSRPVLSEKLKDQRLPATGHLLLWGRLLHAGYWLPDPGRSGESVSRQLEYANGAVFRRALRTWLGVTPTQLAQGGGIDVVLRAFASTQALPLVTRRASVA